MITQEREAHRIIARAFCRAARIDVSAGTDHPSRIPCPCEQNMLLGLKPRCHAGTLYGLEAAAAVVALKKRGMLNDNEEIETWPTM